MRRTIAIPLWIFICFAVGFVASYLQSDALTYWYPILNKASISPPAIVFPIVWSVLYFLMGISAGLVTSSPNDGRKMVLAIFVVQLLFNFLWSISFFTLHNPALGLVNIVVLDVVVLYYMVRSYSVSKSASLLFIPYIVWLMIATYLNGYIYMHN